MMVDMKQIHGIQLDILRKVARLSAKHHIKYFMTGGSAIGAVRHHGFIPWDDDIDIGLTRHDFEKFLQVAPTEFESTDYFVEENRLNPAYEYDFAKVMFKGTRILERGREEAKSKNGIFIDVFPFDKMPINKRQQRQQKHVLQAILTEIRRRFYPDLFPNLPLDAQYTSMTLEQLYDLRFRMMTKYDHHARLPYINLSSPYEYGKERILPNEMNRFIKMPFEDMSVPVLAAYDSYLTRLYGDYMKLPPVEKRIQRHILKASVDNPQVLSEDDPDNQRQIRPNQFEAEAG
ncbi:phosphorylcholine transferase LicD [Lentilactobacillus raoultii]|uniref:Phosphorylcholine transferase LicD n=1 Tax=Lentilactobacillus raoultii TaxID=1987503 RepID=A0ABW3PHN9_9LACO|nr:LicD family protein [Lentilactobacillus raoultii]